MDFFRDVCQTRRQQIFFLSVSGLLQTAMFLYSVALFGVGLHILLIVTDKIGPILDEDSEHLSIGISMELISGFIAGIGLCNAFVCIAYPWAIYTILNLKNHKLHRKKIVSFALSHIVLGFGILCIGILCLLQRNRLDRNLSAAIMNTLPHYKSRMDLKASIDKMQIYYQCCGSKSPSDWSEVEWYRTNSPEEDAVNTAPFSCCSRFSMTPCLARTDIEMLDIVIKIPLKDIWYTRGCANVVIKRFSSFLLLPMGIASIVFFVIQTLGAYMSYLILSLMNEQKPKRKCQKLHFDMENFTSDNCDHDQLGYESSSSDSEHLISLYKRNTLQNLQFKRKHGHKLFGEETDRKASKEGSKKGEKTQNTYATAEDEFLLTAPILHEHHQDEDGDTCVNMIVNTDQQYGSAAKNIANDSEVAPVETLTGGNMDTSQNTMDEESYNVECSSALRVLHETDTIIEESDSDDGRQTRKHSPM